MPQTLWHDDDDSSLAASFERLHTLRQDVDCICLLHSPNNNFQRAFNEQVLSSRPQVSGGQTRRAGLICQVHTQAGGECTQIERERGRGARIVVRLSAGIPIATQMAFNLKAHRQIYALDKIKAST